MATDKKYRRGQQHHMAKLTDKDVEYIRQFHEANIAIRRIAEIFDISHTQVWRIVHFVQR